LLSQADRIDIALRLREPVGVDRPDLTPQELRIETSFGPDEASARNEGEW
jgi:hypothetical protein